MWRACGAEAQRAGLAAHLALIEGTAEVTDDYRADGMHFEMHYDGRLAQSLHSWPLEHGVGVVDHSPGHGGRPRGQQRASRPSWPTQAHRRPDRPRRRTLGRRREQAIRSVHPRPTRQGIQHHSRVVLGYVEPPASTWPRSTRSNSARRIAGTAASPEQWSPGRLDERINQFRPEAILKASAKYLRGWDPPRSPRSPRPARDRRLRSACRSWVVLASLQYTFVSPASG
jgi:hypothetical protein